MKTYEEFASLRNDLLEQWSVKIDLAREYRSKADQLDRESDRMFEHIQTLDQIIKMIETYNETGAI